MQPSQTETEPNSSPTPPPVQPVNSQVPPTSPAPLSSSAFRNLKTAGGIIAIVYGTFSVMYGFASLGGNFIYGLVLTALSIAWLVYGILLLNQDGQKALKSMRFVTFSTIIYAGCFALLAFVVPGFRLQAALFPIIFGVTFWILLHYMEKEYKK